MRDILGSVAHLDDRCPHARPFAEGFTGCPAFQPVRFIPQDSMNRPLAEAITCRHLVVGSEAGSRGRFYPRCALGSRAERLRWLAHVGAERLEAVRALQRDLDRFTAPHRRRLIEARSRLQEARVGGGPGAGMELELEDFLAAVREFLEAHGEDCRAGGLDPGSLFELVRDWWRSWAVDPAGTAGSGGLVAAAPAYRGDRSDLEVVYSDASLEIVYLPARPGLTLAGAIDSGNVEAVSRALSGYVDGAPEFHLDLGQVDFCDLAGMGAIVRSARGLDAGRRLVVHSPPPSLVEVMQMVGWGNEEVPTLVVEGGRA